MEKEQERNEKLNEFENYLSNVQKFNPEIDDLVDDSQSREELERQVLDNNYLKDRIEERRMNDSMYSDRSGKPVKALALPSTSKPNLYKPSMSKNGAIRPVQNEPENIESIEARIARQLEEFHKFKNQALMECSEFLDDVESRCDEDGNKLVTIPDDFDDIVDIAIDEQSQANQNREYMEGEGEGEDDGESQPFWTRYFKADYLGDTDPAYKNLLAKEGINAEDDEAIEETKVDKLEIQKKLQEEFMKIKSLDTKIVNSNKVYKVMKDNATVRDEQTKERIKYEKDKQKEKIAIDKKSYIKSRTNNRGLNSRGSSRSKASQSSKGTKKQMKNSKGFSTNPFTGMRRPSSGKNSQKSSQKSIKYGAVEEEDKSGTFLTGVQQNAEKVANIDRRMKEDLDMDVQNDEDFNYDENNELKMINDYEEILNQSPRHRKKFVDDTSSKGSNKSSPTKVNFIKENTDNIGAQHAKNYTDRLSDTEKQRLLQLEDEIDQSFLADEETAKKILSICNKPENEKLELMSALVPVSEAGETGVISGMKNAYIYEDGDRMERINDELKTKYLALPPCSDDNETINDDVSSMYNFQSSVKGGKRASEKNSDIYSERSVQLSLISKRSGITNFSHSVVSRLSKPVSLPKEKILREKAESKLYKSNIKEIDS